MTTLNEGTMGQLSPLMTKVLHKIGITSEFYSLSSFLKSDNLSIKKGKGRS